MFYLRDPQIANFTPKEDLPDHLITSILIRTLILNTYITAQKTQRQKVTLKSFVN